MSLLSRLARAVLRGTQGRDYCVEQQVSSVTVRVSRWDLGKMRILFQQVWGGGETAFPTGSWGADTAGPQLE